MKFPLFFAFRYLFSRSRINAISWVAMISAVAIGLVTAALVCVLSVYNGYVDLLLGNSSDLDPELVVSRKDGKAFRLDEHPDLAQALHQTDIVAYSQVIQTQGMLRQDGGEQFVRVIGVDSLYASVSQIPNKVVTGQWLPTQPSEGAEVIPAILGFSTSAGMQAEGANLASLYLPKREGMINPLVPASAFEHIELRSIGDLDFLREDIDGSVFLPIGAVQQLLGYANGEVSQIALKIQSEVSVSALKDQLSSRLGDDFAVLDRESQHPELTYLIRTEKVMTYLIMLFILILASFNVASTLTMLVIEKEQNIQTLIALGATKGLVSRIFICTGMLISLLGIIAGSLLGLTLCYIQQWTGFLKSESGFNPLPFPITIVWTDLLTIVSATLLIAFGIVVYSVRLLRR